MSNEVQRRWGIVALAVAMFFVTMINTGINGNKTSFYYWVWAMVGWYGYKGNLEQIRNLMKFLIWLNLGVVVLVMMFFEEQTVGYVTRGGDKQSMILGVLVMLIPKIFIYMYCDKKIKDDESKKTSAVISETQTPIVSDEITIAVPQAPKIKKDEVEIDFSLNTSSFKNSYDVNDYDIAHAKNELLGKIPNVSMNMQLMDYCKSISNSDKEAEKKYILTRAYQISKSISRNEPHKVQSDASESLKILKKHGYDFSTRNESRVNYYSEPKNNGIFSWRSFLTAVAIILAVVVGYNAIGTGNKANEIKLSVKEKINESKSEANFYNNDMSYELKNCFDIDSSGQVFSYKKLKTSIVERYAILISESRKLYFDECILNGRYYQCKNKKDEEIIQITFDVIDMHFWQEVSDEVDAKKFNKKFECVVSLKNEN